MVVVNSGASIGSSHYTSKEFILSGIINKDSLQKENSVHLAEDKPIFQLAPRYILPIPSLPYDELLVDSWLKAHNVLPGHGNEAQRQNAFQRLWESRAVIEARSENDSHAINDILDQCPLVLSGARRSSMPKVEDQFQKLERELRNNYRDYGLNGPYRVDYSPSQTTRILPVQSNLTDAEVMQADKLIYVFNNLTMLRERNSDSPSIPGLMARLGQYMGSLQKSNQDFYFKLKDYISPASQGGMFATLTPEERIKFLVFMEKPLA